MARQSFIAQYCTTWVWAIGVMLGSPLLFSAIVAWRGVRAARHRLRA